jgi:alkylation response protein AidB-like acyl-CoA dehydrogenase
MRALSGKRNPGHEPEKAADPIIVHPDVRKNLLTQKAIAEGGRSMIYECAKIADKLADNEMLASEGDEAAKAAAEEADDDMGFLTPILKGFLTEKGVDAAHLGVQVYGGHGYIKQNKVRASARAKRARGRGGGTWRAELRTGRRRGRAPTGP